MSATQSDVPATSSVDLAADFASFAASVDVSNLDDAVVDAAKANILDTLSCALAGSSAPAIAESPRPRGELGRHASGRHLGVRRKGSRASRGLDQQRHGARPRLRRYARCRDPARGSLGRSGGDRRWTAALVEVRRTVVRRRADRRGGRSVLEVTCRLGVAIEADIVESGFMYCSLLGYFGATAAAGPRDGTLTCRGDGRCLRDRLQLGGGQPSGDSRRLIDEAAAAGTGRAGRRGRGPARAARDPRGPRGLRRSGRLLPDLPARAG